LYQAKKVNGAFLDGLLILLLFANHRIRNITNDPNLAETKHTLAAGSKVSHCSFLLHSIFSLLLREEP
jgi:hypothetical protein